MEFHSKSVKKTFQELSSYPEGLSFEEARKRLAESGTNEIPEKKAVSPVFLFLKQFNSWLVYILLGAALFSFLAGHMFDVYIIAAVLAFNAIVGFVQESKAEKVIRALKKMVVYSATVVRNGELSRIPAKELVSGDVIILKEGDRIPADARLFEAKNLRTMEATLTGESLPVDKEIKELPEKTLWLSRKT